MGLEDTVTRRRMLRAIPVAGSVAVAGCAEQTGEEDANGSDTDGNETDAEPSETESETDAERGDETPDLPNVESQIIQRDKAAITNVRHVVEGTMTWPSARWIDVVDQELLGTWTASNGRITFSSDRTFVYETSDSRRRGGWATRDERLVLEYESGGQRGRHLSNSNREVTTRSRTLQERGPPDLLRANRVRFRSARPRTAVR